MNSGNINSHFLTVKQMKIHYYTAGKESGKTPVIFLHGGGIDSAWLSWGEVMGPVSGQFMVYAPDLPGYGKSDKPDITYSLDFYVDFLNEFIARLGLKKVHLAGLSLGGGMAIRYSLLYPGKVDRLVLAAPYGIFSKLAYHKICCVYTKTYLNELSYRMLKNRKFTRWCLLSSIIYNPQKLTDALFEDIYKAGLDPSAGKAFMSFQRSEITLSGIRSDLTKVLPRIQARTLIIQGLKDPVVPPEYARKANQRIPRSKLCLFEKCRHWPQREQPEKFTRAVMEFLLDPNQ